MMYDRCYLVEECGFWWERCRGRDMFLFLRFIGYLEGKCYLSIVLGMFERYESSRVSWVGKAKDYGKI